MEQGDAIDFKAIRAKFQEEELVLKQPRIKPALPEKPKVVPPPQSPPHYLPAGARPSLLTSINQTLEGKTVLDPRVVFKDEKKESKKAFIQTNLKGKEKKVKESKEKTGKGSPEKLHEDPLEKKENGKEKKLPLFGGQKESTAELVPAAAPPKAATQKKKKGLLGLKKSAKQESAAIPVDQILGGLTMDSSGPAPLIPVPADADTPVEPDIPPAEPLPPNNLTLPDPGAVVETGPISPLPEPPQSSPPPALIPEIPVPQVPIPRIETPQGGIPVETENPAFPVSRPASQNEIIPSITPSPPPSSASTDPPPEASPPSPSPPETEAASAEAVPEVAVEKPPSPPADPPAVSPSPKAERPISALSALERAEGMNSGKKTPPADHRILSALEKTRKKASPLSNSNSTQTSPVPPPPEDLPPSQSPARALPELPPIDYEAVYALPQKPAHRRQATPELEDIPTEGADDMPDQLEIPPPPPRRFSPDVESQDPVPEEPYGPPSPIVFFPPPPLFEATPASPEFSEVDAAEIPVFDDSEAYTPEVPTSEWGTEDYPAPECYANGIADSGYTEIHSEPAYEGDYQATVEQLESPLTNTQDSPPVEEPPAENRNSVIISTENLYEDISASSGKKKGKSANSKKRKGTPKNPYAEAPTETVQEKTKTGRFGRIDKKAAAEGAEEKELKKKERQRLEKEKKELKEKQEREKKELKEKQEREKKEQKEREKRENALKKKFKITGQEEAMYQATVTVTTKGRKDDLPVKSGDVISIIRTTNCPKGKWLAKDSSNNYGYVSVDHLELDIQEMLEVGKKTMRNSNIMEAEVTSTGSRASNHFPQSTESFSDDSDEWTCDDDELLPPDPQTTDPFPPSIHTRTASMPDMGNKDLPINHQHSHSDMTTDDSQAQARYEALQKLATFFHFPPTEAPPAGSIEAETSPTPVAEMAAIAEAAPEAPEDCSAQDFVVDFDPSVIILPPPDLYADFTVE